jgi:hypothetical protein
MISRYIFFICIILLAVFSGCKKNDSTPYVEYTYNGSGAAGDILNITVNQTAGGYTVYNETNKLYDNGSYTVYTNELNGLYKVFVKGAFYYAVEMPGQVFTGNFPTARLNTDLSYVITPRALTGSAFAGNYVYLHVGNLAINGSTLNKEWGILTILSNGKWTKQPYCNDTGTITALMPDEYSGQVPPVNPPDSGTWSVNSFYPNRLIMAGSSSPGDSLTGFAYVSDNGSVFNVDLGFGNGFLCGLKLLDGGSNPMTGSFGFTDIRYDATTGGGKFVNNDTNLSMGWWRADSYGKVKNGSFGTLNQCQVLKNVYFVKNAIFAGDTVDFYSVVSGPYFLEFQFRNNKFRSYGLGARLP